MFTGIAEQLKDDYRMFDYNSWDEEARKLKVTPLHIQVELLLGEIANLNEPIDLVCHSQGCLVAALAQPENIRSALFLAPATTTTADDFAALFARNGESLYDRENMSILQRSDGSQTIVPPEYWDSLDEVGDTYAQYERFSKMTKLTIITAGEEEIVAKVDYSGLENVTVDEIPGADHNFTGEAREKIITKVAEILN